MTETVLTTLIVTLLHVSMVAVGFGFAWLGYRLFCMGVYEKAAELQKAWGDKRILLKQAGPGVFFALFGVVVVVISLMRGTGFESSSYPKSAYPEIDDLMKEQSLTLGTWEKANQEYAILENARWRCRAAGIPASEFRKTFVAVFVPVLKLPADRTRGGLLAAAADTILYQLFQSDPSNTPQGQKAPGRGKLGLGSD